MGDVEKKKATPLHDAAEKGDLATIKALLKAKKVKPNTLDVEHKTALQSAAKGGYLDIVKVLLKAGAKPDIPDHKGRTPLQEAAKQGHTKIVARLLKKKAKADRLDSKSSSPLHEASKKGHPDIVKALMKKGAEKLINQQNYKGLSPLHEAARKGQSEVASQLLELGADPELRDMHGNRPAVLAKTFGYDDLAAQLGDLDTDEAAEAQKIAWLEETKEAAKEIARQAAYAEGRLIPNKAEVKGTSQAAVNAFLANLRNEGLSKEEIDQASQEAANAFLSQFKEEHDAKGHKLSPEELAAKNDELLAKVEQQADLKARQVVEELAGEDLDNEEANEKARQVVEKLAGGDLDDEEANKRARQVVEDLASS